VFYSSYFAFLKESHLSLELIEQVRAIQTPAYCPLWRRYSIHEDGRPALPAG
jgi:hypothetical protein